MNAVIIICIYLLFGLAIWLIKLCKARTAKIHLDAVINPKKLVRSETIYEFNEKHFLLYLSGSILFLSIETLLLFNGSIILAIAICVTVISILSVGTASKGSFGVSTDESKEWGYSGSLNMPSKIFVGDSHGIDIHLAPINGISYQNRSPQHENNGKIDRPVDIFIPMDIAEGRFLEIEIQAAGLTIDGDRKQKIPLILGSLSYHWNCYYPNSGVHVVNYPAHRAGHLKKLEEGDCIPLTPAPHSSPSTGRGILREDLINLVTRLIEPNNTVELGILKRTVKVVKILCLTKRQVEAIGWICGGVAGFTGFVVLILKLVHLQGVR